MEGSKSFDYNGPIPGVENCQNVVSSFDVVPQNDNHSVVETYVAPKTLASKISIPMVENKNNINSDFNMVTQNGNQHLCLDVMACRKRGQWIIFGPSMVAPKLL